MKKPFVAGCALALALVLPSCQRENAAPEGRGERGAGSERVRVKVPEAKVEVAIPANFSIADAKVSGFKVVEKGRDPLLHGTLVAVMPVAPVGDSTPPDATEVDVTKDQKKPDGSLAREGSYKNAFQKLYVAEYVYPVGEQWLYCKIAAAKAERRDEVARLCAGLAPAAL